MKGLLAALKKNWLIPVFLLIVAVTLPASWFVTSGMNKSIRDARQKAAEEELKRLKGAKVKYTLPQYEPGAEEISVTSEPTTALTNWFSARRVELAEQAVQVANRAESFNKGVGPDAAAVGRVEHKVSVEGAFTGDKKLAQQVEDSLLQLERLFVPNNVGESSLYDLMLADLSASGPADPRQLLDALKDMELRETQRLTDGKRDLTDEEKDSLTKSLRDRRLATYRQRANQVRIYATSELFNREAKDGKSAIPDTRQIRGLDKAKADEKQLYYFIWQWDAWFMKDLFASVRLANGTNYVTAAPVKRVVKITIMDPEGVFGAPAADAATGTPPPTPTAAIPGMAPVDKAISVTGRGMGSWNPVYDLRRAQVELIVASDRVEDVIRAIQRTNFMTVTGVDLETVDTAMDLGLGYDYGDGHVVKATFDVESVWLRSWNAKNMPPLLRTQLSIPEEPEPAADDASGQGAG